MSNFCSETYWSVTSSTFPFCPPTEIPPFLNFYYVYSWFDFCTSKRLKKRMMMIKNYIKTAFRNIRKNKISSFLNIAGLAIGLTCFIIIGIYIFNELSFDRNNSKLERIFRVGLSLKLNDIEYNEASLQFPAANALIEDYPDVEEAARLYKELDFPLLKYGNNKFTEVNFFFADKAIFNVFDFKFVSGNSGKALLKPNQIAISETIAKKYFDDENPIGKTITYQNSDEFEISAVFKDLPANSHFHSDFIAPMSFILNYWDKTLGTNGRHNNWYWNGTWTYVLLNEKVSAENLKKKIPEFVQKYFPERYSGASLFMQPLADIHLYSDLGNEIEPNGSIIYVYIFSTIAVFVLFIACINFINLSIAQGSERTKEIGVRKVLGAAKSQLISQIISETIITSLLATASSLILVELLLPLFHEIFGRPISMNLYENYIGILLLVVVAIIVGFISGFFPAVYLSSFSPVKILKKSMYFNFSYETFRKTLVVLQFSISIFLIIGMGMIYKQMNYIKNKDLGFNKERELIIRARADVNTKFEIFKNELINIPGIVSVTGTSDIPGLGSNGSRFIPEGISKDEPLMLPLTYADYDFLTALDIRVKEGRNISKEFPTDATQAFILNEKAVENLGWKDNAIGKKLDLFGAGTDNIVRSGYVVGVIEDYNYESLHSNVKPLVLAYHPSHQYYIIRLGKGGTANQLEEIEKIWNKFSPDWAMESFFLDSRLEALYQNDQRLGKIVNNFGVIALLVACLGLYGLASFAAKKRIKEIGIRKVLGASVPGIIKMLSFDFIKLVLIANLMAFPAAFYLLRNWLSGFAYHVDIDIVIFFYASGITIVVALVTVGFQAAKAAISNPIEAIKYE